MSTVNVIIHFMWSQFAKSQITLVSFLTVSKIFAYSVYVISLSLAQSDDIKQCLLYIFNQKKSFLFHFFYFFAKKVFIAENRNLTHVEVPNLRRHEISVDLLQEEKLEEVSIKRNSPSQATIRYRPGTFIILSANI